MERSWLRAALQAELVKVQRMEREYSYAREEAAANDDKMKEQARKVREMAQKRLRREFEEQQNAMRDKQEREAEERRRRVEAQKEAEAKQAEWLRQREEQREREYQEQMGRLILMQAEDRQRMETLDRKKHEKTMDLRRKKEEKERMLRDAAEKDAQLQRDAIQQEQNAKKQFQLMMKRKLAADEARRKLEDFQNSVLDHRQQVESRLQQHELKRKKYLEFKKELEGLKGRNKEMNIARQQRRENFRREQMAESLALKMAKAKVLEYEKTMLWNERRKVVAESNRQRELVKDRVAHMKEKSNYSARELEEMIRALSSPHRFSALYGDFDIAKTATVFQDSPVSTHRSMGTPVAGGRHTKSSPSLVQAGAATMAAH
uniref:Uncharacterized protein n=1 Tax=Chromera velia CCMP2878 TaxID=1169474 RepID=A0A0G4HX80_9ALVE|eukprot:Cvel_9231.t1-p1 / transcript=Cvel_9231.t1 / gene=Cvel_9231 / organism=Chromera_velia_CCMP2878 / gene_product=hypothetical protein / transcript_product=hypothetical protein / location=Cvel_scaffold526:76121-81706(-) / protein_length=374 / sequence_SO=supercontig / SO=protein_coding / is_pseudo=false